MKLSVVIPFYFGSKDKPGLLHKCISSLDGHDELIVIGHKSESLPWALNNGIAATHGRFVLILSDDMELRRGTLRDLCHPYYVTHPLVNDEPSVFGGAICFPKNILDKIGKYDENFLQGYYDDDDMIKRLEVAGFERRIVPSVNMNHPNPGTTLKRLTGDSIWKTNKKYYERKWGKWEPAAIPPNI